MLAMYDDVVCQLFHGKWAVPVSYSRQGQWACTKAECRAEARHLAAESARKSVLLREPLLVSEISTRNVARMRRLRKAA